MRDCLRAGAGLTLGLALAAGPVAAEDRGSGVGEPLAQPGQGEALRPPGDQAAELERSLAFIYAEVEELREQRAMSAAEILAVGTGAGVGFTVGAIAAPALVVPAIAGMTTTAGMTAWAEAAGATAGAITAVASTWGGAMVGDALID